MLGKKNYEEKLYMNFQHCRQAGFPKHPKRKFLPTVKGVSGFKLYI